MKASFTETLPLVRVQLPDTDDDLEERSRHSTRIGNVILSPSLASRGMRHGDTSGVGKKCFKEDHWYGSVEQVKKDWALTDVTRVDLVTTARFHGWRFAAIGFYLGYRGNSSRPSFYIIEAGNAFNSARQVFFAEGFASSAGAAHGGTGVAEGPSTYNPTRLSSPQNYYKSWLSGGINAAPGSVWDPSRLVIKAAHPSAGDPATSSYITIVADLKLVSDPTSTALEDLPRHKNLMCRAAGRVWKLESLMGPPYPLNRFERVFGKFCKDKDFNDTPEGPAADTGHTHTRLPYSRDKCR